MLDHLQPMSNDNLTHHVGSSAMSGWGFWAATAVIQVKLWASGVTTDVSCFIFERDVGKPFLNRRDSIAKWWTVLLPAVDGEFTNTANAISHTFSLPSFMLCLLFVIALWLSTADCWREWQYRDILWAQERSKSYCNSPIKKSRFHTDEYNSAHSKESWWEYHPWLVTVWLIKRLKADFSSKAYKNASPYYRYPSFVLFCCWSCVTWIMYFCACFYLFSVFVGKVKLKQISFSTDHS